MDEEKSSVEVAAELIRATRQDVLRRAASRHKGWAKVLRGFRPQALTKELALTRAGEFAAAPQVLRELAEAFLQSAGVPEGGRLEERLAVAAANSELPEAVRQACRQLAGEPAAADGDVAAPAEAAPEPEAPAPSQARASRRRARKALQA